MTLKQRFRKALFAFFKEEIISETRGFRFEGPSPWLLQQHPATCDCSGREKCERFNKTGEGEMIVKDGWFQCPCGEFKQHKIQSK